MGGSSLRKVCGDGQSKLWGRAGKVSQAAVSSRLREKEGARFSGGPEVGLAGRRWAVAALSKDSVSVLRNTEVFFDMVRVRFKKVWLQ